MSIKRIKEIFNPILVDYVVNLDWTPTKKYTHKICEFIINDNILFLDIDNTKNSIDGIIELFKLFDRYSINFEKKDIMQYSSYNELYDEVNGYISKFTSNKMRNMHKVNAKQRPGVYIGTYNDYDVFRIDSFTHASKYSGYCSWCITKQEYTFKDYTNRNQQFYFLLKKGYENILEVKGENSPDDEYGLSMLAVCIANEISITTRWNMSHDKPSKLKNSYYELSTILKVDNIRDILSPYSLEQEIKEKNAIFSIIQLKLDIGIDYKSVFKVIYEPVNGFAIVSYDKLENFINVKENKLVSPKLWFTIAYDFKPINNSYYAVVCNGTGTIVINENGNVITDKTYKEIFHIKDNQYFVVNIGNSMKGVMVNTMDCNGNIINEQWFVKYEYNKPFSRVTDSKNNHEYLDKFGKILEKK